MTDPTNAVSSEAPSTLLSNLFCRSRQPSSSSLVMVHKIPKAGHFSMDACMCSTKQKWKIVSTFDFPFRTKPKLAIQYSNHYKTTKDCSHLISNSQQNCKCQLGFSVQSLGGSGGSKSKQWGECHTLEKATQASGQPQQGTRDPQTGTRVDLVVFLNED